MTRRRRVVVTGMGVISAAGLDLETFWDSLVSGRSYVRAIEGFDASGFPARIGAEIRGFELGDHADLPSEWGSLGPIGAFAGAAASRAVEDAGLFRSRPPVDLSQAGVLLGTGPGRQTHEEIFAPCAAAHRRGSAELDWLRFAAKSLETLMPASNERRMPGSIPAAIARRFGFRGPVMTVMTACAASTQALGDAARWIASGTSDIVLAGGADSELYPLGIAAFSLLGALSRRNGDPASASRPFDAGRDGFVMGEGAGVLVLEEREHAQRRGARIYAELAGFGSAADAYRVTDPEPEGRGAVLAMSRALASAGVPPEEVGYVNAHGTSTMANDAAETRAIKSVFGAGSARLAVSSTKSMIGHLMSSAGAVEAIATVLSLRAQAIHPTINYERPDPDCDLDYVPNVARRAELRYAMSNSFGFGGQCSSLLFARAP